MRAQEEEEVSSKARQASVKERGTMHSKALSGRVWLVSEEWEIQISGLLTSMHGNKWPSGLGYLYGNVCKAFGII